MYYLPFRPRLHASGRGWRTAGARALHTTRWIRRGGFARFRDMLVHYLEGIQKDLERRE